jgi:hypothetical protein
MDLPGALDGKWEKREVLVVTTFPKLLFFGEVTSPFLFEKSGKEVVTVERRRVKLEQR